MACLGVTKLDHEFGFSSEASRGGVVIFVGMKGAQQRVFTPGTGAMPPALTGREREQAVLTRCLADLLGGTSPPHDVVLTGPRGNGKTVLLNWFERTCRDHAIDAALATTGADATVRLAVREELNRLGYIWTPPGQLPPVVWTAGIPSLMTHVLDHAPPLRDPAPYGVGNDGPASRESNSRP